MDYHIPLNQDGIYHILSHAVGNEKLFRTDENYRFFLQQYFLRIQPIADTFSFCLLPNHFHFLIRIRQMEKLEELYHLKKKKSPQPGILPDFIMEQFSNLLNSYTKSYNKYYRRRGALFVDYLRRVEVKDNNQYTNTIFYIHKNPVHHGISNSISDWRWSSYQAMLGHQPTDLLRSEVLEWFGGIQPFINFHQQSIDLKYGKGLE